MPGIALFIDHENIFIGLKEMLGLRAPDRGDAAAKAAYQQQNQSLAATLATGLRREVEKMGALRVAFAVANFSQFDFFHHPGIYAQCGIDPRYNLSGRNSADTFLHNLVNESVSDPRFNDMETYVLVTGDGGYFNLVNMLLRSQKQVHVWGVSGHTSHLMEGFSGLALTVGYVDRLVDFSAVRLAAATGHKSLRPYSGSGMTPPFGTSFGQSPSASGAGSSGSPDLGHTPAHGLAIPRNYTPPRGMAIPPAAGPGSSGSQDLGLTPAHGLAIPRNYTPPRGMAIPPGYTPPRGMAIPPAYTPPRGMAIPPGYTPAHGMAIPPAYTPAHGLAIPPAGRGAPLLSDLQVLAATFHEFLAAQRLDFLSPRLFLDFLEQSQVGGPDDASRNRYMGEALQIGVLKEEKVWLGDREGLRILPNPANDVVIHYRLVRDNLFGPALVKPLHPTDSFRPKRSFIVSSIQRAAPHLDSDEIHRWLDWFVSRGALVSTYERLPRDAQPANILKMCPEHPMVQAVLAEAVWSRVATPLLVLTVATMLSAPKRPWVALSLLLRHIGDLLPVSREDLRVAIGEALERGLLVKQEYPNPRRAEPTSGVFLGESPEVTEILELARDFLSRAVELARPTGQVPISFLIQQCAGAGLCDADYEHIKDWITILEKAGMLLLRGVAHPALPGQTMTVVSPDGSRCRAFLGPDLAEAVAPLEAAAGEPMVLAPEEEADLLDESGAEEESAAVPAVQVAAADARSVSENTPKVSPAAPSSESPLDPPAESPS